MNLFKFGIAGYGKMGKIREQTLSDFQNTSLVAIFEINEYDCRDKNVLKCNSFEELIHLDIDAIIISSYVSVAADYVIRALESGKHVFCEKPPAMNANEIKEVIQAEKNSGKVLKYGFNHRFHYSVMEAMKIIDSGSLGNLLWMRGVYGKAGSIDYHENWRNYKNYSGGGILLDQGIHMLDLFRYFTNDEFECLSSHLTSSFWNVECEDNAFLILKSDKNVVATLHSSATQWKHKFLLELTFENGYINLDGILSSSRSYTPEKMITGMREFEDITFAMGKPKETTTYYEYDESWNYELKEFIDAINKVAKIKHGTSQDALEIMKLIDSIYQN
jgi:predicted dehydrogenase